MVGCLESRPAWAQVSGGNISRQEWMRSFLTTLCETLAAAEGVPVSSCSVAGVWDRVTGSGYLSDQEFYAASQDTLCLLKDAIGGGGVGTNYNVIYDSHAARPATPPDVSKVWVAAYRNGETGQTWDPVGALWF